MKIDGISVDSRSLIACYRMYYPSWWDSIAKQNLFHYLHLWGIRVSTCDTSLPDDMVGGLRVNNLNYYESVISKASTEPTPKNLVNLFDAEARAKGGSAFVMEGQYLYRYIGTKKWKPLPAFCPTRPVRVYRWRASDAEIRAWNKGKGTPLSSFFQKAIKEKRITISTSSDTCIHRTWRKENLYEDSAGCQVLTDDSTLRTLGTWADDHIAKKYGNSFMYTLFTKEQFLKANSGTTLFGGFKLF